MNRSRVKGEKWEVFRDRHGDWGRDLALWAGRRYCGMRLGELALKVGVARDSAITMAVKRLRQDASKVKAIRRAMKAIAAESEK